MTAMSLFIFTDGELYQQLDVVGLNRRLVSRAIAMYLAASGTFMNDNVALFRVGLDSDRLHKSHAIVGSVTGVDVKMLRPKAEGAMIPRAVAQRLNLCTAMLANK